MQKDHGRLVRRQGTFVPLGSGQTKTNPTVNAKQKMDKEKILEASTYSGSRLFHHNIFLVETKLHLNRSRVTLRERKIVVLSFLSFCNFATAPCLEVRQPSTIDTMPAVRAIGRDCVSIHINRFISLQTCRKMQLAQLSHYSNISTIHNHVFNCCKAHCF